VPKKPLASWMRLVARMSVPICARIGPLGRISPPFSGGRSVASLVKTNRWYRCLSSMTADIRQSALLNRKGRGGIGSWCGGSAVSLCCIWFGRASATICSEIAEAALK
jgi:hypothetical protein